MMKDPLARNMRRKLTLDVKPEFRTETPPPVFPHTLGPRSEDRSRWLMLADLVLKKKRVAEMITRARTEQEQIKQEIRKQVENYRRLRENKKIRTN
jgi:hypothetical protein